MRIIVTGATGTTGSEVIRQAILDKEISPIVAFGRRIAFIFNLRIQKLIPRG